MLWRFSLTLDTACESRTSAPYPCSHVQLLHVEILLYFMPFNYMEHRIRDGGLHRYVAAIFNFFNPFATSNARGSLRIPRAENCVSGISRKSYIQKKS